MQYIVPIFTLLFPVEKTTLLWTNFELQSKEIKTRIPCLQGHTDDFGAPGLTGVMGPSHVGRENGAESVTHVLTIDYDTD